MLLDEIKQLKYGDRIVFLERGCSPLIGKVLDVYDGDSTEIFWRSPANQTNWISRYSLPFLFRCQLFEGDTRTMLLLAHPELHEEGAEDV